VGRLIPIIADEYADPEHGSGAVKITPAHDFNDFEVGKRHNLEMINIFDERAHLNDKVPEEFRGLERFEARKKILKELEAQELLFKVDDIKHSVPYGDRSDVIVEPYMTMQWFCDTPALAVEAGKAVRDGRTQFVPRQYENMYFAWVDGQLPWCISRQLWWGHQIPAWYGPNGELYVAETEKDALAQATEKHGESVSLTRDPDVLDTWFSSGLWPFSTLGWPEKTPELSRYFPTSTLVTGFDIISFWVSRMMFFSLELLGQVPFKDVYIHALVRDEKGQKMSKSKGNVIDPLDMIEKYGTDALRFTIASMAAQGRDVRLSEERIAGYRNFTTKIWNAAKYCEMNGCAYDAAYDPNSAQVRLNKWIIQSVKSVAEEFDTALESYRFNDAAMALYQFTWNSYCDWYVEFSKSLLKSDDENIVRETKATLAWVLKQIITLLNPVMPFITEELNAVFCGEKEALIAAAFPDYSMISVDQTAQDEAAWLFSVVSEIRSVRSDMNVPAAAQIPLMIKDADPLMREWVQKYRSIIMQMARIKTIDLVDSVPGGALQVIIQEATLALPVAEFIDLGQERARLQREIDKLSGEVEKIDQKLANENFVQNAPEDIVEEHRSRKQEFLSTQQKLSQALRQLEAA
jgi:valyl-tRNA synthetase